MALLRFSVFEIDPASGELTRQGRRVPITAQAFTVLHILASRPQEVVTRLELRRALWSDETHVDFERGLNFCVAAVRRALGDDARRPRFVETVPRRGYRFIAEVRVVNPQPTTVEAALPAPHAGGKLAAWAAMLLLLFQLPASSRVHSRETAAPAAIAAFERGQDLWEHGPEARLRSLQEFESAARIDGRFAEAHYAVAATFVDLASRRTLPAETALVRAERALRRAVELQDVTASRQALGAVRLMLDWDWEDARRELQRAIDLAPDSDGALVAYARLLSASGDDEAALDVIRRAERINPGCSLLAFESAVVHYRARRYDEALGRLATMKELVPLNRGWDKKRQFAAHDLAFLIHLQRGDWAAAHREAAALIKLHGGTSEAQRKFVTLNPEVAVKHFLARSLALTRPEAISGTQPPTRMALVATLGGHTDEALAWLERSVTERDIDLVYALRHPAFDTLRQYPRFQAVERQVRRTNGQVRGSVGP